MTHASLDSAGNTPVFTLGGEFRCNGRHWRCTDIGMRVIIAICLDTVTVESTDPATRRTLSRSEAEQEGWFNGPPYAVPEVVFDENDQPACTPVNPPETTT